MSLLFSQFDVYQSIDDIEYIIGLDLSTVSTGIVLYSVRERKPLAFGVIEAKSEDKVYEQYAGIKKQIEQWKQKFNLSKNNFIIAKEKQPVQYGVKTTIITLISIAKIHGLIENYCFENKMPLLDIAVVTIRKQVLGESKADKMEVFNYICSAYPEMKLRTIKGGKDISDALCVCLTGIAGMIKFYEETIKELRKEKKRFTSAKKLQLIEQQINILKGKICGEKES